jgi:type VI secretion system secreted protein VgrG
VTVSSVNGSVLMRAEKEFIIECGGAFIRLSNGCITLGAPHYMTWAISKFINRIQPAQMHLWGRPHSRRRCSPFR